MSYKIAVVFLLMGFCLSCVVQSASAQENQSCTEILTQANEFLRFGRYESAIALADECKELPGLNNQIRAYEIIARARESLQQPDEAREALRRLFELNPDFQVDASVERPPFVALVNQVREESQDEPPVAISDSVEPSQPKVVRRPNWKKIGIFGGGGVVVLGVVACLTETGICTGGGEDFAPLPGRPGGN